MTTGLAVTNVDDVSIDDVIVAGYLNGFVGRDDRISVLVHDRQGGLVDDLKSFDCRARGGVRCDARGEGLKVMREERG